MRLTSLLLTPERVLPVCDGKISTLYLIFYRLGVGRQNDHALKWL